MKAAVAAVKPGMTESQVAAKAEYAMRRAGAEEFWRTYVSSGPRTNIAHGLPTLRKLQAGDLVMIDIHPIVNGYSADICRTVCVGKPTAEQQAAYDLYLKAQQTTIAKVKAGVGMVELEQTLHEVIKEGGHGGHIFGPPIHGVGIDFEESPLPPGHAFFHGEKEPPPLEANMVIAVGNCGLVHGPVGCAGRRYRGGGSKGTDDSNRVSSTTGKKDRKTGYMETSHNVLSPRGVVSYHVIYQYEG